MTLELKRRIGARLPLARATVAAGRMYLERQALATAGRDAGRLSGRILCYHSVDQADVWRVNDVPARRFAQQIESALAAGFSFVSPAQIAVHGGEPNQLAMTFDDNPKSVLTSAAPVLASYGIPFSVFVVADWAEGVAGPPPEALLGWDDVLRVAELGGEIGNHSATHPDFARLSADEAAEEIGRAAEVIEKRTGIHTSAFAIPFGQSGNWPARAARAARCEGYSLVYAQCEQTRPPGTVARTFVTRFDSPRIWRALLRGRYDRWEEWY